MGLQYQGAVVTISKPGTRKPQDSSEVLASGGKAPTGINSLKKRFKRPRAWKQSPKFSLLAMAGRRLKHLDWRLAAILLATLLSAIATWVAVLYGPQLYPEILNPADFWGSVFASWVGGVISFAVIGSIVAVVSLVEPERAGFDERARILFQKQSGKHIEYIIKKMQSVFEHYAERTEITYIIDGYHPVENKFWMIGETHTVVRNYIEDIDCEYKSNIRMLEVSSPPAGERRNRIVYLRVNGKPLHGPLEFDKEIDREFDTVVSRSERCSVEHCIDTWVEGAAEPNTYAPVRYTQSVSLDFFNHVNMDVKITLTARGKTREILLSPGEQVSALDLVEIKPGEEAFLFHIAKA
jgi:hypothetical protein